MRGSDRLINKAPLIEEGQRRQLIEVSEKFGKILDWCWYGQPGIDGFCGRIRVDRQQVGGLVEQLLEVESPRIIFKGFPEGIPDPTEVLIDIGTQTEGF